MRARPFCYDCHRPADLCLCRLITPVPNRTEVVILQHVRERFHPFGSVRLLDAALERCRVHVAFRTSGKRVDTALPLPDGAALLYPRPGARTIETLPEAERPRSLVLLDGTWSQAHRLYRDNPWLQRLPHLSLKPTAPSLYRVRREPHPHCLSTLEAAVHALSVLEPDCEGLPDLLGVFARMNAQQLERRREQPRMPRRARRSRRPSRAVPEGLRLSPERVVVVYGESALRHARSRPGDLEPMQWTAMRLDASERFERFASPARGGPEGSHLRCMGLPADCFTCAPSLEEMRLAWQAFLRPGDVVAAWNASTLRMHSLLAPDRPQVLMRQAYANLRPGLSGTLEDMLRLEQVQPERMPVAGRASQRLGNAHAMATWLRQQADTSPA